MSADHVDEEPELAQLIKDKATAEQCQTHREPVKVGVCILSGTLFLHTWFFLPY